MRDLPGETVDVQLQQTGTPGGVRLALGVKHKPWAGSVGVNNRGSAYLGRTQIEATLLLNGLLRQGDQTRLTVAFPTELERFRYISLGRTDPLGSNGATLNLSVGHLVTKPKIAGASLAGKATTAGAQVSYPLIRSDQRNLFLTGGLDGLNSDNALFGQLISSEHTRVLRVAAAYSDAAPRRARSLSATLSRGVDGLGARIADPLVDAAFTKLNAQAGYQQQVGKQAVLRLAASAQYSGDRLPASEQFTFGGAQFGRAYASAVAVGDTGYAGSVEIAWRPANGLPKALAGSEVYGFADAGRVSMKRNAVFAGRDYDLSSAGAGVRVAMVGKAVLELEAAKALENPISRSKPWRLMLSMRSTI
jgi:hemolysin activation/secretion protein